MSPACQNAVKTRLPCESASSIPCYSYVSFPAFCSVCEDTVLLWALMEIQLVTVKEETRPVAAPLCPLCQEELPSPVGLQGQTPQCQECKSMFLEPGIWLPGNQEAPVLPAERPYTCAFCPKRFKRASDRRDHERVHTGERPYECGICGKRFTQSSVLSGHMRIHTGERPFCCGICLKSFNNGSNFRKHQRIHGQPYSYGAKRNDATLKVCTMLPGKQLNLSMEGQDGSKMDRGITQRQNGHQIIEELKKGDNSRDHNLKGRQNELYVNGLHQDCNRSNNLHQPVDSVGHFKRIRLRQDFTNWGPKLDIRHGSHESRSIKNLRQAGDGTQHITGLGGHSDCSNDQGTNQNTYTFRRLTQFCGDSRTKSQKRNREGGSDSWGDQKQRIDVRCGMLQLDGGSCGKGLFQVSGSNRVSVPRLSQVTGVGIYDFERTNGLTHNGGGNTTIGIKPSGRGGSHVSGLRQRRDINTSELRPNGSYGDRVHGLRQNGIDHFREAKEDGGAKDNQIDFQVCNPENMSCFTANVSIRTCPDKGNAMAWEKPNMGPVREKGKFDRRSSSDRPDDMSSWEPESHESPTLPYVCVSSSPCSLQDQLDSTIQQWEESPPSCFSFQEPEPHCQRSQSAFDSKPFLCFACPKQFRRATDLKEHLRVHTGERPFGCTVCGKRFTQSSALATHRRLHTGEKPFECAVCYRRFNNSSNFAKHRRLHGEDSMGRSGKVAQKELQSGKQQ